VSLEVFIASLEEHLHAKLTIQTPYYTYRKAGRCSPDIDHETSPMFSTLYYCFYVDYYPKNP
jgi:hypothetical protein